MSDSLYIRISHVAENFGKPKYDKKLIKEIIDNCLKDLLKGSPQLSPQTIRWLEYWFELNLYFKDRYWLTVEAQKDITTLGYFVGISEEVVLLKYSDIFKVYTCISGQTGNKNVRYQGNDPNIANVTFMYHFMRIFAEMMLEGEK